VPPSTQPRRRVTILGAGYTGRFLIRRLLDAGYDVIATRRRPPDHPDPRPDLRWIPFDLEDEGTYHNIEPSWGVVWLFPPVPLAHVREFLKSRGAAFERSVVIGTTSSYLQKDDGDIVTEAAPIDVASPRVEGETLLQEEGAVVLRSAGIYGPGRNPLDWLRLGRIPGGEGYVNLVHADDLAAAIVAGLESSIRSDHFIVTDGTPMQWGAIAAWALKRNLLTDVPWSGSAGRPWRRLSNAKLLSLLHPSLTHTDLFGELERLENGVQLPNIEMSPAP
jgi:nucleoside-diphosphate-sugar epimerase